jgi:hypothetical protein
MEEQMMPARKGFEPTQEKKTKVSKERERK